MNRLPAVCFALGLACACTGYGADTPAAPAAPAAAPAAAPTILIVNFTEPQAGVFGYGTWKDRFAVAQNAGFRIMGTKGALGNGGFCQEIKPAKDLSKCAYVELALAIQPGNEVPEYGISLVDADGSSAGTRVRISQIMPGQPVWMRVKLSDFQLSTRDPGKNRRMDWGSIVQWHLQGDWATQKPANILFIALRGRE